MRVPGAADVTVLLQQQQGMLSQILLKQEEMERRQSDFQVKLCELETTIQSPPVSSCSPDTDSSKRRKRVVNKELSVSDRHHAFSCKDGRRKCVPFCAYKILAYNNRVAGL